MSKHERSEYMKGVLFAEEQKEIGWVFRGCNYEKQSLEWRWNSSFGEEKPRQIVFAENEFFDGVIDYQKHMKRFKEFKFESLGTEFAQVLEDNFWELVLK